MWRCRVFRALRGPRAATSVETPQVSRGVALFLCSQHHVRPCLRESRPWVRIALVTYFTPNDPQNWLVVRSGFVTARLEMQRRATTPNRRGMAVP